MGEPTNQRFIFWKDLLVPIMVAVIVGLAVFLGNLYLDERDRDDQRRAERIHDAETEMTLVESVFDECESRVARVEDLAAADQVRDLLRDLRRAGKFEELLETAPDFFDALPIDCGNISAGPRFTPVP